MAVQPKLLYPAQIVTTDTAYPYGKARNDGVPGDASGTPLEKAWVNDLWGFLQALLVEAGMSPSGDPDKVGESQYLEAIRRIVDLGVGARTALSNWSPPALNGSFYAVASNPDGTVIVAAGQGVQSSLDGGWTWTQRIPPSSSVIYTDVIWDGTRFVVGATGYPTGGMVTWASTDGVTFSTGTNGGAGGGDIMQALAYDPVADIYVGGATTGKVFARSPLLGTVQTAATGLAQINSIQRGVYGSGTAFMAACNSGGNGGLRFARPNAVGIWTSVPGTISAADWMDCVYSAKLDRWYAISKTGDMMSMTSSGTDIRSHAIEGSWSRLAMNLVDDRYILVVGQHGHVAFGEPDAMRTTKLNTDADLYDVDWNGRLAYAASLQSGVIRSFSRY